MQSTTTTFRIRPISSASADELRAAGGEIYVADTVPGYPCRQCLRDAAIGEELILVSHDPFSTDTPYRSASPIFLHRLDCSAELDQSAVPRQLAVRQLSVRAFDKAELMTDADVIDGGSLAETLDRFFADDSVRSVHVHNASRGCWAATVKPD